MISDRSDPGLRPNTNTLNEKKLIKFVENTTPGENKLLFPVKPMDFIPDKCSLTS